MFEALALLLPSLAKLLDAAFAPEDEYDAEKERQAMLDFESALSAERLRRRLAQPR